VFFDRGANVPVGLPVVRTSVDHGIACDVSGQGVASDRSLRASSWWLSGWRPTGGWCGSRSGMRS